LWSVMMQEMTRMTTPWFFWCSVANARHPNNALRSDVSIVVTASMMRVTSRSLMTERNS
jgi:hypothetical protein